MRSDELKHITCKTSNLRIVDYLSEFLCGLEKEKILCVAVAVLGRFSMNATQELSVLGSMAVAIGGSSSIVAISGGSHVLAQTYVDYLGNRYQQTFIDCPFFASSLLKQCL